MSDSAPSDLAIDVRDLCYTYPGGPAALDKISLRALPGERIGLVGPNGAGKTTFFLCLAGVLRTSPNAVRICNLDPARSEERKRLPAKIGIVFQNSDDQIFSTTVRDDVAFGPLNLGLPADEVQRRVAESLAQVSLQGVEDRVPFHLSGGEKRRVALAGVLAMRPDVLLLDEPSIHLDPHGRRELIRLLNALPGTRIIAAHDFEMILETCDRVVVLDKGRQVADGPARQLLADAGLMEAHGLEVPYSLRK